MTALKLWNVKVLIYDKVQVKRQRLLETFCLVGMKLLVPNVLTITQQPTLEIKGGIGNITEMSHNAKEMVRNLNQELIGTS